MASFTCHRHLPLGGGSHYRSQSGNDNHKTRKTQSNNNSHLLRLVNSTLASTPLCSDPGQVPSSSQRLMPTLPSLDLSSRTISPTVATISTAPSSHTIEPSGTAVDACIPPSTSDRTSTPPSSMDTIITDSARTSTPTPAPFLPSQGHRTPKRKRTVSPPSPSSNSPEQLRSGSRSTRRSTPHSRGSSLHSHRRTATTTSLTPSLPDSPIRRESLLALHRESCRLFQDQDVARPSTQTRRSVSPTSPSTPPRPLRTASNYSSPPVSPTLTTRPSMSTRDRNYTGLSHQDTHDLRADSISTVHPTPTVIDWTSPSTRRKEYEEIDRASSGVRGFWRRVAPRWCQFGDRRMPFFEEGKDGKGNYEGSVRRFRMDIPDEPVCETSQRGLKLKKRLVIHTTGGRRRTWKT